MRERNFMMHSSRHESVLKAKPREAFPRIYFPVAALNLIIKLVQLASVRSLHLHALRSRTDPARLPHRRSPQRACRSAYSATASAQSSVLKVPADR